MMLAPYAVHGTLSKHRSLARAMALCAALSLLMAAGQSTVLVVLPGSTGPCRQGSANLCIGIVPARACSLRHKAGKRGRLVSAQHISFSTLHA